MENYQVIILLIILLFLINFFLKKNRFLIDHVNYGSHKIKHTSTIPLSGGIFFLVVSLVSILIDFSLTKVILFLFLFILTLIGIFADLKPNFSPKFRLFLQTIICLAVVIFFDLSINKVNLAILDEILKNSLINCIFTTFCLLTLINGCNFCDGVNLNVSLYFFISLFTIFLLHQSLSLDLSLLDINLLNFIIFGLFIFALFNFFSLNFLGDNGVYFISLFSGILVIDFIKQNSDLSPFFAVILLWYPAFENLFSIIRKKIQNIETSKADQKHLHTKIYFFLTRKLNISKKITNSLTGLLLNILMIPNFCIGYFYYNNSFILLITNLTYISIYVLAYKILK